MSTVVGSLAGMGYDVRAFVLGSGRVTQAIEKITTHPTQKRTFDRTVFVVLVVVCGSRSRCMVQSDVNLLT